jgi:hypothetical protein
VIIVFSITGFCALAGLIYCCCFATVCVAGTAYAGASAANAVMKSNNNTAQAVELQPATNFK